MLNIIHTYTHTNDNVLLNCYKLHVNLCTLFDINLSLYFITLDFAIG